jgi:hypothetical protein
MSWKEDEDKRDIGRGLAVLAGGAVLGPIGMVLVAWAFNARDIRKLGPEDQGRLRWRHFFRDAFKLK